MKISLCFSFLFFCALPLLPSADEAAGGGEAVGSPASPEPGDSFEIEGVVVPVKDIKIASPGEGIVAEVCVNEGDFVKEGDVILKLNSDQPKFAFDRSEAVRKKAAGDFETATTLMNEKLLSRDEYKRTKLEMDVAETEAKYIKVLLDKMQIRAAADGFIFRILKDKGESVQGHEHVATLLSTSSLYVNTYLPESRLGTIHKGDKVRVIFSGTPPETREGEVRFVDPILDTGSNVFRVKCLVENRDMRLSSGTRARVVFFPATPASEIPGGEAAPVQPQAAAP